MSPVAASKGIQAEGVQAEVLGTSNSGLQPSPLNPFSLSAWNTRHGAHGTTNGSREARKSSLSLFWGSDLRSTLTSASAFLRSRKKVKVQAKVEIKRV